MRNLFWHEIRSRWPYMAGLGVVLAMMATMYIAIYPTMMAELENLAGVTLYRMLGIDLGSFAGYIASVIGQFLPLVISVYMVVAATGSLAGEEENGTLELVVAAPVKRWHVLTIKALALMVISLGILLILSVVATLVFSVVKQSAPVDVTEGELFIALLSTWPLMIALIMMSLFFASVLPTRTMAVSLMLVVIILSYLFKSIAGIVQELDWLRQLSIFHYADTAGIFEHGVQAGHVALLLGLAALFYVLALWGFERRSLTVGAMPWWRFLKPRQPQTEN